MSTLILLCVAVLLFPTQLRAAPMLSKGYLSSTEWGPEDRGIGSYLTFDLVSTYNETNRAEGGGAVRGSYQVKGGVLYLKAEATNEYIPPGQALVTTPQMVVLVETPDSLVYGRYLERTWPDGSKNRYWDYSAPVPAGSGRIVDGVSVVTLAAHAGTLTADKVFLRAGPDRTGSYYQFRLFSNGTMGDWSPFLPKGSQLRLLARTRDKMTIENASNYWYYVAIQLSSYDEVRLNGRKLQPPVRAWIFGKFAKAE